MTTAADRGGAPTWAKSFAAIGWRLRDDMDIDRVEADVLGVIDRTFHPEGAAVWLR